ncbi:MAG TPA: restriction endonuclease subunit S [Dissulfurispiraceae bacterium]|nr:restriction endonuclease subunit S [Dissulfurispiraceae bacterium]
MSEWKECTLKNVLGEKGYIRGPFGSALKRGEMQEDGIPVYEQKNAIYNDRTFRFFIGEDKFKELSRFQVKTNDLIISCSGTVGKISVIKEEDPKGIISQALLILRPDVREIDLRFLYYFLSSRQGFELLTQASHGSVQINIAERKVVESIPLILPPLPEQKAIASVLSGLDDKIDLLHRQNKTLEAMAETLFRQWFVEEAQADWEEGKVNDLIDVLSGFAFKSSSFADCGIYRLMTIKAVQDGYLETSNADTINDLPSKMPDYCHLQEGDILLSLTGNVGRCCLVDDVKLLLNQRVAKLKPKNERDHGFAYIMFRQAGIRATLEEMAKGTAQANLSPVEMANMEIQIPPENLLLEFSEMVTPSIKKILANKKQIKLLENLRDTLLPKLMSGEVRVAV